MARCSTILLVSVALLGGKGLGAQTRATATLRFDIPAALRLETVATEGAGVGGRSHTEGPAAVVLRVTANCPWRLVPIGPLPSPAVEVRAAMAGGARTPFQPLGARMVLASGGRGREMEVIVDYRLPPGMASPTVSYRLEPADE